MAADAIAVDDPLPIPPLSPFMFSDDVTLPDDFFSFDDDDDFFGNITFNNNHQPSGTENLPNSTLIHSDTFDLLPSDPQFNSFDSFVPDSVNASSDDPVALNVPSSDDSNGFFVDETLNPVTNSSLNSSPDNFVSDYATARSDVPVALNVSSPDDYGRFFVDETLNPVMKSENSSLNASPDDFVSVPVTVDVSGAVNVSSPDEFDVLVDETMNRLMNSENSNLQSESRNMNPASSQGSGNCGSDGSEAAVNYPSPDSGNSVVNQKMKRGAGDNSFMLKRKNVSTDVNSDESRTRTFKHQRSNETSTTTGNSNRVNEEDEKKKARLIRNRESAQISRQRKKQYVEELEDKVKGMQATIHDLNARIAYIAAENATLKQQMVAGAGTGTGGGAGIYAPGVMYPPHPAMAPMGYPWAPYPPYAVKSYGSQVPLVPIPKLKPQQPAEKSKKDGKKTEGKLKTKTKKAASISFIGLLLFILLFGGLVPIMNMKFGGVRVTDSDYPVKFSDHKFYNQQHNGRVLMGDEHVNGTTGYNASEPLVASLYVPRNNKLVKIDGSLIINSVLASEKAMAFREQQETSKELVPAIPIPTVNSIGGRQPRMYRTSSDHQRALPSNEENLQPKHGDGRLQQWFREGLSGLMLSSGMCTEVFQFDTSMASASGAIVPATSAVNITATENRHNSTYITTVKNRRILHGLPIPLPDSTTNITKEQVAGHDSKHEDGNKHNPVSSMVVSVLVDPREAGDGVDVDGGMMGGGKGKSFSRIFVVVLLDSVKYVTYSCMLPLKGINHHLVTA